jgi:hypothetical protein
MAMLKGVFKNKPKMTKIQARKSLSAEDRKALPLLGKKCTDKLNPEFGMWQEDRLVRHIVDRLRLSDGERRLRVQRCSDVDIQLSGVIKHDRDDLKRDRKNKRGHKPQPIAISLALAYAQIDEGVTYCMSLFAPETNMFVASAGKDKQPIAEGLTKEVGKQGQKLQYFRQVAKFVLNGFKYNFGALSCNWEQQTGTVFTANTATDGTAAIPGQLVKTQGLLWQGNVIKSCDTYNFLYDTSVHPVDLPLRGEYFAEIEATTAFRVRRMNEQKILFGIERYVNDIAPLASADSGTFYMIPPIVREPIQYDTALGMINWQQILAPGGPARESQLGIELDWFTGWVKPQEYSLSDATSLELWRICVANGKYITSAVHLEDSHGQLPVAVTTPIEDDLRNDQRTYAEMLLPLQQFASFLLNTHVDASRKAIYGITVFDQNLFPGIDLSTEDLIGMRIPMKSSATGIDIDKAFRHYNAAPQTDQNVDMVAKIVDIMQKIMPTNQAQQVADLERATEYQAAATVQSSNRRNLKIARLINDQALSVIKFQMMYNIFAKMTVIEYVNGDGQKQQITPQQLVDADIEFDIGTGLKGIDRLMQVSIFKDVMSYLFQVKDIGNQVDLLALLSYVTEIAGFETDLTQFKLTPEQMQANAAAQAPTNSGSPGSAPNNTGTQAQPSAGPAGGTGP